MNIKFQFAPPLPPVPPTGSVDNSFKHLSPVCDWLALCPLGGHSHILYVASVLSTA